MDSPDLGQSGVVAGRASEPDRPPHRAPASGCCGADCRDARTVSVAHWHHNPVRRSPLWSPASSLIRARAGAPPAGPGRRAGEERCGRDLCAVAAAGADEVRALEATAGLAARIVAELV